MSWSPASAASLSPAKPELLVPLLRSPFPSQINQMNRIPPRKANLGLVPQPATLGGALDTLHFLLTCFPFLCESAWHHEAENGSLA